MPLSFSSSNVKCKIDLYGHVRYIGTRLKHRRGTRKNCSASLTVGFSVYAWVPNVDTSMARSTNSVVSVFSFATT